MYLRLIQLFDFLGKFGLIKYHMSIKRKFIVLLVAILSIFIILNLGAYLYISSRLFMSGKLDTYMISASIIAHLVAEKGDKECYNVIKDRKLFEYMPMAVARVYNDSSFDYICGLVNDTIIIQKALKQIKGRYGLFHFDSDYIAIIKDTDTEDYQRFIIIFAYEKDIKNYIKLRNSIIVFDFILFLIFGLVLYAVVRRLYFRPFENLIERLNESKIEDEFMEGNIKRDETALVISSVATLIRNLKNEKAELIKTNEELKKAQDDLIRTERLSTVGKIAASIAHEVGTPLGTVRGYIDIVNKGIKDGKIQSVGEYLKRMDNEIVRISNILRELLDYARPPRFNMKRDEINSVITEVINFVSLQKSFSGIGINFKPEGKMVTEFDRDRVKQILINLLMNAKDAMHGDGEILITLRQDEKFAIISIKDSGCGINDADKDKIFEPFYTTKPAGQGSGLGLAIVKRLVESMNGRIEFESIKGQGTIFSIFLKK